MKIAIYSRKSVFTGKGDSIENQIQLCKNYIELHYKNAEIIIYEDEGYSGASTNRPQFQKMLLDAKSKAFNILICYRLDRISRSIGDFASIIKDLEKHDISFISIKEQFDTSSPLGRAMMYISSVFAQLERETIAERVRDNMLELAKKGNWTGGTIPLGFNSESISYLDSEMKERKMSKLDINEEEIELVKIIYDKFLEFNSINKVVGYMQENRYKSKTDKHFIASTISYVLSNTIYVKSNDNVLEYLKNKGISIVGNPNGCGILTYNKTDSNRKKRPMNEWISAVAKHKGIIDGDKWILVQEMLARNTARTKNMRLGSSSTAVLSGLMRCVKCGKPMKVSYSGNGRKYHYYSCSLASSSNKTLCDNKAVRGDHIEQAVIDNVLSLDKTTLLSKISSNNDSVSDSEKRLNVLEKEIKEKKIQVNKFLDKLIDFDDNVSDIINERIKNLSSEIKDLESQYNQIFKDINNTNTNSQNTHLILNALDEFKTFYNNVDDISQRKLLLSMILDNVTWNGDTKEVAINFWGSKKKA